MSLKATYRLDKLGVSLDNRLGSLVVVVNPLPNWKGERIWKTWKKVGYDLEQAKILKNLIASFRSSKLPRPSSLTLMSSSFISKTMIFTGLPTVFSNSWACWECGTRGISAWSIRLKGKTQKNCPVSLIPQYSQLWGNRKSGKQQGSTLWSPPVPWWLGSRPPESPCSPWTSPPPTGRSPPPEQW